MVLCTKHLFGPATSIFLSAVIILSCFTDDLIPSFRYYNSPTPPYFSPEPIPKCNIFRGEWVPDPSLPQYTNETCSYIQNHQNCLMYGRPDREFLKWRWKPDGCDLLRFDPHKFLQVVGNKTLAFVGDSLARNHYQSLLCLLSKVALPKDLSDPEKPDDGNKIMYYEGYNFTIKTFWSPFLIRWEEVTDSPGMFNLYLDEAGDWTSAAARVDYLILSAANWFTRQTYFYERRRLVGGKYVALNITTNLTSNRYSHRMAFRTSLRALINGAGFRGKVIVRTVSPMSHFEGGAYNAGGDCKRRRPYWANETVPMSELDRDFHDEQVEEFGAAAKEAAARGVDMVLMDPTVAMLKRPDGHPSRYGHWPDQKRIMYNDCIHWCLPGPIDAWNDMLLHILTD